MPIVRVEMLPGRSVEQKRRLAAAITTAMVEIAKAKPEQTSVLFQEVKQEDWAEGGRLLLPEGT